MKINNRKIRIHVKNNRWAPGSFPNTPKGQEVFTITDEHIEAALNKKPNLKKNLEFFIDWDEDNFTKSIATADVLLAWNFPKLNLEKIAPKLKWIHCIGAGVEHLIPLNWLSNKIFLTNNKGVHAEKSGEYGLMSILMLHNHIPKIIANQSSNHYDSIYSTPINRLTIVIVGTGSLGGAAARMLTPLGPKIIGVNRHGNHVEGCNEVITSKEIDNVLPLADILYLAMPATPETNNLINRNRLNLLKKTCGIVNVGRQSSLDYEALCDKLDAGEIAGAILDVFTPEPIASDSRLWKTPNLIITPHVSADDGNSYVSLTIELFLKNLELFMLNKPLINQVEKELGY